MSAATLRRVERYVATSAVDIKRRDAIALLEYIRDLPRPLPPFRATFAFERSALFEALYERDRAVRHDGVDVPLAAIANYAALHLPGFRELNFHALNRALVGVLAEVLGAEASEADIDAETRRFRVRHRLTTDAELATWIASNDLEPEEFRALMRELALCHVMQRWLIIRKFLERTTRLVLDELRITGQYERLATEVAAQERILSEHAPYFRETSYRELSTQQLVIDHLRATACRMDTALATWTEEAGFHSVEDLRVELLRARVTREVLARTALDLTRMLDNGSPSAISTGNGNGSRSPNSARSPA
jgi:hypothetical protein